MADTEHLKILITGVEAWNQWRERNPEVVPDLAGADLRGRVLSTTNSAYSPRAGVRINLRSALLSGAQLQSTGLKGAILKRANMEGANLTGADLRKADIRFANFSGAKLNQVNFTLARIYSTNFSNSHIWETVFSRVDLSNAVGLDSCVQPGPSLIDDKTFRDSEFIPLEFLRGCGLSDWQIEAAKLNRRSLSRSAVTDICYEIIRLRSDPLLQFYSCFISYSHGDKDFAFKLYARLQDAGIRCWLDEHQLLPGDDIFERVDAGIRLWDKILLCCSKASLTSWWVDNEILTAFDKEQELMKERREKVYSLIPINLDNYVFDEDFRRGYRQQILSRMAADFTNWKSDDQIFQAQADLVVRALKVGTQHREQAPPSRL